MSANRSTLRSASIRLAAFVAVVSLLAAACGSDDGTTTTTGTADTTTTTTAAETTTTTIPATTTTTVSATTTTAAPTTTTTLPDTNALAEGSGCTPGTADSLPDGEWFGYVDDATSDGVDFDLACWFTGDAAALAAAEDGEESPPPNDYYVRNENPALRALPVASDPSVTWFTNTGDPATEETVTYADWIAGRATRSYQPGVWLTIESGAITAIHEQYVP